MLLSRFWYVVLGLSLGAATFILFVAAQMYNRAGSRAMAEALSADSSAVDWYLRDDARKRAAALIPFTLSSEISAGLAKSSSELKIPRDTREKTSTALKKLTGDMAPELKFDAIWAVDADGRVVAANGFEHTEDWELGGYASVADALHGWIRDDAWVWKGRIYRVVARPVEREAGGEPVGAIVGAKIVDDTFARSVTKRTGAAVGFYADGARVASGAPEGFDKGNLDEITRDLKYLEGNKDYEEKGRSEVRVLGEHLGVVYARLPGEAWELGAGYAVGRLAFSVNSPFDFLNQADNTDKSKVPTLFIILGALVVIVAGLVFSILEHTKPLLAFRGEAVRLAKGEIDMLQPSKFRGAYKQIASDLNDGIDKVAAKGGAPRKAADLEQVLGPLPAQPQMSAFSVPGPTGPVESTTSTTGSFPKPKGLPKPRGLGEGGERPSLPQPKRATPAEAAADEPAAADDGGDFDELEDWRKVFEEFLAVKTQCGEPTAGLTFEKFKGTLQRNKEALVSRHNCSRVKFTVYVKEGKAALKASPVK